MAEKTIITRPSAPVTGAAAAHFVPNEFDKLVQAHGALVNWERGLRCPCASRAMGNSQLAGCRNCGGSGWVFINKIQTQMVLQHQNLKVTQDPGGERFTGDVQVTTLSKDKVGRMDRITFVKGDSLFNQLLQFKRRDPATNQQYAYTVYPLKQVEEAFLFVGEGQPLRRLTPNDYAIEGQIFMLSESLNSVGEATVSLTYTHAPQYYIVELPRSTISVNVPGGPNGKKEAVKMPLNAIARKAEYVLDQENFDGDRLLDNSYLTNCTVQ